MQLYAAITKVDATTRTVTGIAMQEVVDRANEKCLYEESKPFFQKWSDTQAKASGGKSKGNIRVMHTSKVAGVATELVCDDALKAFIVTSEIVDDDEWKMVEKGGYTGYSIGANFAKDANGKAIKKMVDGVLEWAADPVEISLVDVPCVPTALFELKTANGEVHMHKFANVLGREKSMYSVSDMANALQNLRYIVAELDWEAEYENDDSNIPDRLREWMKQGAEIFLDLAEEETSEFASMITAQKAARVERLKKGGCSCDCTGCSDCTKKKAAETATEKDNMTPEQTKALNDSIDLMKSLAPTLESLKAVPESLKTITTTITGVDERLKTVEVELANMKELTEGFAELEKAFGEQPEPTKAKAASVPRDADTGNEGKPTEKKLEPSTEKGQNTKDRLSRIKTLHKETAASGFGLNVASD